MMTALAISLPPSSHFIYIPVVLVIGIVVGFMLGAKATRDEIALGPEQHAVDAAGGPFAANTADVPVVAESRSRGPHTTVTSG